MAKRKPETSKQRRGTLESISHIDDDLHAALSALRDSLVALRHDVDARLTTLEAAIDALMNETPDAGAEKPSVASPHIAPGDQVYVPRLGGTYAVTGVSPDGATVTVRAGALRVEIRRDELWSLDEPTTKPYRSPSHPVRPSEDPMISELDLHGYTEADALVTLELFLHHSFIERTRRVRVIHGKGDGVLRSAVRHALAVSPLVTSIDSGPQFTGDDGVTLADLDV